MEKLSPKEKVIFETNSEFRAQILMKNKKPKIQKELVNFVRNREQENVKELLISCLRLLSGLDYKSFKNPKDKIGLKNMEVISVSYEPNK